MSAARCSTTSTPSTDGHDVLGVADVAEHDLGPTVARRLRVNGPGLVEPAERRRCEL